MRIFHHYGIPTTEQRDDETLVEVGGFKFYSTPFEGNRWHIQWHRFPEGHGLPELVTQVPHLAFQVDDLDREIEGANILFGPYSPLEGYRVAMIEEQGVPIELVETKLSDEELSELERKEFNKGYYP
ncbi:putative uncharacterized protein [Waddlia chondrophila 2032/99]|uniref:VOC domain-containing protein n=2 Tax=Waddlia chondrophila TaxID=71667 RepID=D6YUR8_WADCW|nr:hypothetical protein [Waddlia chondrophila]ADI37879.1 conserved hypothetical protein [Waddlia chondrophila WSU 86-1044]CCB91249.1 putative uncharacterized protein [Waddlia chondrophila 2032/99]